MLGLLVLLFVVVALVKILQVAPDSYKSTILILEKFYSATQDIYFVKVNVEGCIIEYPVDLILFNKLCTGRTYLGLVRQDVDCVNILKIYEGN